MKKYFFSFVLVSLVVSFFPACSSEDEEELPGIVIPQVKPSEELVEFIKRKLPYDNGNEVYIGGIPDFLIDSIDHKPIHIHQLIINSQEEFVRTFTEGNDSYVHIPQIDFDKYTFVIGQISYPQDKTPTTLKKQILYKADTKYKMQLQCYYHKTGGDQFLMMYYVAYWGLYPKLENLPLEGEIKFIK